MANFESERWGQESSGRNVGDTERRLSVGGGALAALAGLRRGGLPGLIMTGLGAMLLYRGSTGHCPINQRIGRSTASPADKGLLGRAGSRPARLHAAATIDREAMDLYNHWREFSNLAQFMRYIEEVRTPTRDRSHWVAQPPMVGRIEWDAEVSADVPGERIAWRSVEGSEIETDGEVRFRSTAHGTEVEVDMSYRPKGAAGAIAAKFASSISESMLREDLRRFKRLMESGEIPTAAMSQ